MTCGRLAYFGIKMDPNISRYEEYIANQYCSHNAYVGDLNHGKDFAKSCAYSFF